MQKPDVDKLLQVVPRHAVVLGLGNLQQNSKSARVQKMRFEVFLGLPRHAPHRFVVEIDKDIPLVLLHQKSRYLRTPRLLTKEIQPCAKKRQQRRIHSAGSALHAVNDCMCNIGRQYTSPGATDGLKGLVCVQRANGYALLPENRTRRRPLFQPRQKILANVDDHPPRLTVRWKCQFQTTLGKIIGHDLGDVIGT